jgi:predicted RNA-binding Zn-ribbon protein involved in translation (DUF1610 family)
VGVILFTALTGILVFWLLGFVVDDLGEIKGPQQADVEKGVLDQKVVKQIEGIDKQIAAITAQLESQKSRQALLRDSTTNSQQTMNQLLDMQKLNIQNNVKPSTAEQNALAQSETLFIANQTQYQSLNQEIARHTEDEHTLEEQKQNLDSRLAGQRQIAAKQFEALDRQHHLRVAALQLLVLVPLLVFGVYLVLKWRNSIYAPLAYAFGVATLTKVIIVIHENFPTRYFKYVLLLFSLAVVVRVLIYLIRATASPKMAALLKQYREAYERFLCPICEFPIRRGPLKFSFWDRRSIRNLSRVGSITPEPDDAYACPSCGASLFERCTNCKGIRHALLPYCEHCGHEEPVVAGQPLSVA